MAIASTRSHEIELFEPPAGAVFTIDATSRIVDVPRRTIVVYCKHKLLSPAFETVDRGYYFNREAFALCAASELFEASAATISPESRSFSI